MSIIDHFKKSLDKTLQESMANFQQNFEAENEGVENFQSPNGLIEQIESTDATLESEQNNQDYESQQFKFFASKNTSKMQKCVVCKKLKPKYTCPKCKVKYCSHEHFKTHNLFCTQRFFKEQVQNQLKMTKVGKQEKRKMIQILRQNQRETSKDQRELINQVKLQEISQQRLQQILNLIQKNEKITLSDNEIKNFESYIKDIELLSMQSNERQTFVTQKKKQQTQEQVIFEQYIPFWTIQQGLSYYFVMDGSINVEQYNQSKHKELILYRQLSSQILRQDLKLIMEHINFKKTSVFVDYDLIQVIYLSALLFRSFNGEYLNNLQFVDTFLAVYDQNLARNMAQIFSGPTKELLTLQINVFGILKTNLLKIEQKNRQIFSILKTWISFAPNDSEIIFKNKFLCLQTLFRILQSIKSIFNKNQNNWSDEVMKETELNKNVKNELQDKQMIKMVKKLEFLISYTHQIVYKDHQITNENMQFKILHYNHRQLIMNVIKSQKQNQTRLEAEVNKSESKKEKQNQKIIDNILIPQK